MYGGGKALKRKGKKKAKVRSTLFKGCIFYFNGRTINSSALHIQKTVRLLGAEISCVQSSKVTHVICTNLALSKEKCARPSGFG
eukprot:UN04264